MQRTLTEVLQEKKSVESAGITFISGSNNECFLSYKELYHAALRVLGFFQRSGIKPKDELVFQIEDNQTFLIVFWACILGKIIPVPLSIGQNDNHKQKLFNVWPLLNHPFLIISKTHLQFLIEYSKSKECPEFFLEIESRIIDVSGILSFTSEGTIFPSEENDIAFVQFSSGSTGNSKGVILTHRNLLTNIAAISEAAGYVMTDSMISWMPLTHDMGLIGFHLNPLLVGMQQYLIPTNVFIRNP